MVDPRVQKLALKLRDLDLASRLVAAGFDNPAKIRKAADKDLKAVPGVGQASVDKLRKRLPKKG